MTCNGLVTGGLVTGSVTVTGCNRAVTVTDPVTNPRYKWRSKAATAIADSIGSGDLVLVKASRGVTAELVVDAILARGGEMPEGSENASTRGGA